MSDERERLARNLNSGIETASGCAGCGGAILLLAALPVISIAAWALIGASTGSDWGGTVAGIAVAVWIIITAARLAGWGR